MADLLVFDEVEVTRVAYDITSWVLVFDEPSVVQVEEDPVTTEFLLFDAPPPQVTTVSSPQDFLLIDEPAPPPATVSLETSEDILVITTGGPPGNTGEPGPQGPPGADGIGTSYELTQGFASPSTLWVITHGFGTSALSVNTFDHNGDAIEGNVRFPDDNSIEVEWFYPTSGSAQVFR